MFIAGCCQGIENDWRAEEPRRNRKSGFSHEISEAVTCMLHLFSMQQAVADCDGLCGLILRSEAAFPSDEGRVKPVKYSVG